MSKKGIKILEILAIKNQFDSMSRKLDNLKIFLDFEDFDLDCSIEINNVKNLLCSLSAKMMEKIDKIILK